MIELDDAYFIESLVLTAYGQRTHEASKIKVFATMSSDINAIPAEDFLTRIFDSRVDSLGTEWITDKKPAKYVGATQNNFWLWI